MVCRREGGGGGVIIIYLYGGAERVGLGGGR